MKLLLNGAIGASGIARGWNILSGENIGFNSLSGPLLKSGRFSSAANTGGCTSLNGAA